MLATNENTAATKTGIVDQIGTIWGGAPIITLLNGFRTVRKNSVGTVSSVSPGETGETIFCTVFRKV